MQSYTAYVEGAFVSTPAKSPRYRWKEERPRDYVDSRVREGVSITQALKEYDRKTVFMAHRQVEVLSGQEPEERWQASRSRGGGGRSL